MKRKLKIFLWGIFFIFAFFSFAIGKSRSLNQNEISKLSYEVLNHVEKNEDKIKVIVELEEKIQEKGRFGVSSLRKVDKNSFIMQNKKIGKKIKHNFLYSNAFSAELSSEEIQELLKKPEVKKIYYDYPVRAFLQDSVPLINASSSWGLDVQGINLTGKGQTICVIDTGVDYTHPDFGSCGKIFSNTSVEQNIGPLISPNYPNNYPNYNGCVNTHNISANGDRIEIYFQDLNISERDFLFLRDERDNDFWWFTNESRSGFGPISQTNFIKLYLCTRSSSGRGYNITKIKLYNLTRECKKIIDGHDFYNGDFDPIDDEGHGTHVAGIVGANGSIKGVAPDAKIVAVKSLNEDGEGYDSDVIAGIEFCINKSEELNISVICMSLGGELNNTYCDDSELTTRSINFAVSKNISVVVATGNNDSINQISYPACVYNATRVGSTTKSPEGISSFSNRWGLEMLVAPGSNINSTKKSGGYEQMSGTSMATPHVSGAIAIIKQYLKMINKTMTPKEIEQVLNKTGKNISADGRIYKRIDVYSALMELDEIPPVVNISGPSGLFLYRTNYTFNFNCSAEDWQLKNITLYLWNSTGIVFNDTKEISGKQNFSSWTLNNLYPKIEYNWSCNSSDLKNNVGKSSVFVFEIKKFLEMYPLNESYTNVNETNFFCNVFSFYELKNLSFYLWNQTDLIKNETKEISGNENSSVFNFTFSEEGAYVWACEVFNVINNSQIINHTIFYDVTLPEIAEEIKISKSYNSVTISFNTTEKTNSTIELIGKENKSNTQFSSNHSFSFGGLSSSTLYEFNISFCDGAGNCNYSNGSFTTDSAPSSGGGSSGGGGGGSSKSISTKNQVIKQTELVQGVILSLSDGEEIKFQKINQNHTLKINKILNESVNITIRSEPINFLISVGEEKKFNLSSKEFYDLYIKLNEIKNNKANLTIKEINERIFVSQELDKEENQTEQLSTNQTKKEKLKNKELIFLYAIFTIIVFFILFFITKIIKRFVSLKKDEKTETELEFQGQ